MLPDIKLKEFYLRYIYNADRDVEKYKELLTAIGQTKEELYNYIKQYETILLKEFDLDLNHFSIEWIEKKYNDTEYLYKTIIKYVRTIEGEYKTVFYQLLKYCYKLKEEYKTNKLIFIANKRKVLSLKEYKSYVNDYYMKVHKILLEGFGYKYQGGIGTYLITYYKLPVTSKRSINFAETNKRKKELLEKGYKLYDEKEAAWYKARNIPYNGIDYRVYQDNGFCYEFTFINSKIFKRRELDYKRTEYVHAKLRGMSYKEMADNLCNNVEDIINLNVDLKYKLNILVYKYPEKYLNFVRNDERSKYKY